MNKLMRPSSFPKAWRCTKSVVLAEENPTTSEAARYGSNGHQEISWGITSGREASSAGAKAAIAFARDLISRTSEQGHREVDVHVERPVTAYGQDCLTPLALEGTPDLVIVDKTAKTAIVVDWKFGDKHAADVEAAWWQLHVYGIASLDAYGCESYQPVLVYLGSGDAEPIYGPVNSGNSLGTIWMNLERLADEYQRPAAKRGIHCTTCYVKNHCKEWQAAASNALTLIGKGVELNTETAPRLMMAVKEGRSLCDTAEQLLKGYVKGGGEIVIDGKRYTEIECKGAEAWDREAMERDGIAAKYRKPGKPYKRWDWTKVR